MLFRHGLGTTRIPKYLVQTLTIREVEVGGEEESMYFASNQSTRYFFVSWTKGRGTFNPTLR